MAKFVGQVALTTAGVNRLKQVSLRGDIIERVEAAYKRTQEMGQDAGEGLEKRFGFADLSSEGTKSSLETSPW